VPLLAAVAALVVGAILETGLAERWMRRQVVRQIERGTGARVELGGFHFHAWRLQAEMDTLTLHGLEAAGTPPLFHAEHIHARIRIVSFFSRQIALDELVVEKPQVAVRFEKNGRSNLPAPKVRLSAHPWRETLFNLRIGHLELRNGSATFNDRRISLAVEGQDMQFTLRDDAVSTGAESYIGNFRWQQVELAERGDRPFRFDIATKFTLHRDAFELDELVCNFPHSNLNLRAELPSFSQPDWNLHYRGQLSLEDMRTIFRKPTTPDGITDFSGQARYTSGEWTASGHYAAHDIRMRYRWFHAGGFETFGDYQIARHRLIVPNLRVRALGGTVDGRLEMDLRDLAFRSETRLRGAGLAATLAALDNPGFPVHTLHWDSLVDADSVNTWDANFKHFRTKGQTRWSPPGTVAPGMIPAAARIDYDYSEDKRMVELKHGEITMPETRLEVDGTLGAGDSALELRLRTDDLLKWNDFINIIRGADAEPRRVGGKVDWKGRILGPLGGPTFIGHLHANDAVYEKLFWNEIDGNLEYSPDAFRLTQTLVRRGRTSTNLTLALQLDGDWGFLPGSAWTLEGQVEHAPSDDLQAMFETNYPVSGFLSGNFRGSGTRDAPVLDARLVYDQIMAKGVRFDRLSGQLHLERNEVRLYRAELQRDTGRIAGDILYRPQEQQTEFDVTGREIPLDKIGVLKGATLPIAGQLDFELRGSGPLRAPVAQGDLRLANLQIGSEVEGNFRGRLASDGQNARLSITSDIKRGKLQGEVMIGLAGDTPISGHLSVEQFEMDTLIVAALHLKQLTGHSSVDGLFAVSGALRHPDTIVLNADIAQISFDYQFVQLKNDGPVQLTYRRNEVRVEQAHLHGTDTDLLISGSARFDRDRPLHFTLSGSANLALAKGFLPDLQAMGRADANVSVEGTMSRPRITGRASVHNASATYADFPLGLSNVNGDVVFNTSRLLFDRVSAESGGGQLTLSGNVSYGDGPLRYEISVTTPQVRIRYPVGMSWLAGGTLELSGTSQAALLSGRVQLQRLLFVEGVDVASFFATASETISSPASSSPFMRNLSFDVEGKTIPGARIEWSGARIDMDGEVRLRGTWDRPVLLGHIHLLGGEMAFRGNDFDLTRGDINFANPFRLDPVLNVEATASISQYQVTLNFSGPASRLSLTYRSDPPLPDTDIIALLALGSTGEESALRSQSATSQNYGATALLSEAISSGLGGRIEHLFGVSHFRVDPFLAGTTTESNAAARITIEQQVAHDLTITYSTNATSNQEQLIQVEYAVKRGLSVVFLRDINGTNGLDIKFVKHFE
jgi:translocation and assembly module TamB